MTTELLDKDLRVETFSTSKSNWFYRPQNGVKLTHLPTGLTVYAFDCKSQNANRQICIETLKRKLKELEMTTEIQAAAAEIAEREKTINCTSLSASQMMGEAPQENINLEEVRAILKEDTERLTKQEWRTGNIRVSIPAEPVIACITALEDKVKKLREALQIIAEGCDDAQDVATAILKATAGE